MMQDPENDPLVRELGRLVPEPPDARRSARTRVRCHAALARQRATGRRQPLGILTRGSLVRATLSASAGVARLSDLLRRLALPRTSKEPKNLEPLNLEPLEP